MKQVFHIFKKDAWHLRYEIGVALALTCFFTAANVGDAHNWWRVPSNQTFSNPFTILISIAWAFLVVRVIQSEALPGDRQFWITRPYSRASLLVAKIAFLLLFANLPMLISDAITISANGFAPFAHVNGFVAKQVLLVCMVEAPLLAISAVTRRIGEFVLTWIVLGFAGSVGGAMLQNYRHRQQHFASGTLDWLVTAAALAMIAMAAIAMVGVQFKLRRTLVAQAIGVGGLAFAGFIFSSGQRGYGSPMHMVPTPSTHNSSGYSMEFCGYPNCRLRIQRNGTAVSLEIPVRLSGHLNGNYWVDAADLKIRDSSGSVQYRAWGVNSMAFTDHGKTEAFPIIAFEIPKFEEIKSRTVNLELTAMWSVWDEQSTFKLSQGEPPVPVPGVGMCAWPGTTLQCRCAFEWTNSRFTFHEGSAVSSGNFVPNSWPIPADGPIDPIQRSLATLQPNPTGRERTEIYISSASPVTQFWRSMTLRDILLAEYE